MGVFEISYEDWLAVGEKLFGPDRATWRFKCCACGHVQTAADLVARRAIAKDEAARVAS